MIISFLSFMHAFSIPTKINFHLMHFYNMSLEIDKIYLDGQIDTILNQNKKEYFVYV